MSYLRSSADSPPRPVHDLAYQIRQVIEARGLSSAEVGRLGGVDRGQVARFVAGSRDLTLGTAGRICAGLGLRLVEVGTTPKPKGRAKP